MNTLQDLRFGFRILGKSKGFTVIAVLTLALGIGSSAAVFSIVNAILLKPLPYPHAERIVIPWQQAPIGLNLGYNELPWGLTPVRLFRRESKSFQDLAAFQPDTFNLTGAGEPVHLQGLRGSAAFFPALSIGPASGRAYTFEEDQPGHEHELVLGDRLWREHCAADPGILRRTIALNGAAYLVVGVMPAGGMGNRDRIGGGASRRRG